MPSFLNTLVLFIHQYLPLSFRTQFLESCKGCPQSVFARKVPYTPTALQTRTGIQSSNNPTESKGSSLTNNKRRGPLHSNVHFLLNLFFISFFCHSFFWVLFISTDIHNPGFYIFHTIPNKKNQLISLFGIVGIPFCVFNFCFVDCCCYR